MLELLNQLDGFASDDRIKVLAATNRVDVLDPALLRSGRLDRKIEFPLPNEEARAQILKIHSRKMTVDSAVNWGELARSTDEFGGAMLKAVCVEAGMIALRMGKNKISHEHYVDAIAEVQSKKKEVSLGPNHDPKNAACSKQLPANKQRRPSTSTPSLESGRGGCRGRRRAGVTTVARRPTIEYAPGRRRFGHHLYEYTQYIGHGKLGYPETNRHGGMHLPARVLSDAFSLFLSACCSRCVGPWPCHVSG